MPRDHYEVLGVPRTASADDIKKAYRKLARENHPDRNPGDKQAEVRFKEIQDAYDVLSDAKRRSHFDHFGSAGPQAGSGGPGGGFHWGGTGFPGGGFRGGANIDPEILEEMLGGLGGGFGDIFGQQARQRGGKSRRSTPQAQAKEQEVSIDFQIAALGGKLLLHVGGREIELKIPAGTEDGKIMRLRGQAPGGADLDLKLRIQRHPYFSREGNNILLEVPLSLSEAVLGATVDVPTLDGSKLSVKIPPGTSSGARLRLRGKGISGGDQFIEIKIVVPAAKDERSRQLIEEFSKSHPQNPRANAPWAS